jgi:hypothetical protein
MFDVPKFDPAVLCNSLLTAGLTVSGALILARFGPRLFIPHWDERKLKYDLFKSNQLVRITTLRRMLTVSDCVYRAGQLAMHKTGELNVNSERIGVVQDSLNRLAKERQDATSNMSASFSELKMLATEYGTLPPPLDQSAGNLIRIIDTLMQQNNARINNAAASRQEEGAYQKLEGQLVSDLTGLCSLIAFLVDEEEKILVATRPGDKLDDKIFRRRVLGPVPHAGLIESLKRRNNPE